jgi:cytidylate kinase
MNTHPPIVTIDGPSGSGKGTIAQLLAKRLGWHYLDSGALYRVLGLIVERSGISPDSKHSLADMAKRMRLSFNDAGLITLDGEDVSQLIRSEAVANNASRVAAVGEVRRALLDWQRDYLSPPGLVADGRDMGSVVFPGADLKIFLTASAEERAMRRYKQLLEKGLNVNLADLTADIERRDERDRNRAIAPLVAPAGALELDGTHLSIEQVLDIVLSKVCEVLPGLALCAAS